MRRRRYIEVNPERAIVLDTVPFGFRGRPTLQLLGLETFSLIEAEPKEDAVVSIGDVLEPNDGRIKRYIRYIRYDNLSSIAKEELENAILKAIDLKEDFFVNVFNKAGPISPRLHALELIPGIGQKLVWKIIEERKKEPFKSLEDIEKRIPQLSGLKKMIARRIIEELSEPQRFYLFVRSPILLRRRF